MVPPMSNISADQPITKTESTKTENSKIQSTAFTCSPAKPTAIDGKIYTRRTQGFFQRLRRHSGIPLLLLFLLLPWFSIDGRPALLIDLPLLKVHLLWMTFWPQDGILLTVLLITAVLLLFAITVAVGRIWCGFTCPQTVWTLIFIWVEDRCEGDRQQRIKLDQAPWDRNKLLRKVTKHLLWLLISLLTSLSFVAYFYGMQDLLVDLATLQASAGACFWVLFFLWCTYLNAGWLREQVCKHMCPYARFQSVMYDEDTLLVSYDKNRGEPRRRGSSTATNKSQGDCVDCTWCVQVCPVDIDIRDGLQYACIDCGLCADACNQVMDKLDYQQGLIRFTSQRTLNGGKTQILRTRLTAYLAALVMMLGLLIYLLAIRTPLDISVVRDRGGQLYERENDKIKNIYWLEVSNRAKNTQTYELSVSGNEDFSLRGRLNFSVDKGEVYLQAIEVLLKEDALSSKREELTIIVRSLSEPEVVIHESTSFIGPD